MSGTETELLQQVAQLTAALEQVKEEAKGKMMKALNKIKEFHGQIEMKNSEAAQANAKIDQLEQELFTLKEQKTDESTSNSEMSKLKQEIEEKDSKLKELDSALAKIGDLEQKNAKLLSTLEQVKEKTMDKLKEYRSRIEQRDAEISTSTARVTELELELSQLKDQNTLQSSTSEQYVAKEEGMKNRIVQLEEQITLLTTEKDSMSGLIEQKENEGRNYKTEVDDLHRLLKEQEIKVQQQYSAESAEFQQKINDLTTTLTQFENRVNELNSVINQKDTEASNFSDRMEEMKGNMETKTNELLLSLDQKDSEINTNKDTIAQLNQTSLQLQEQLKEMTFQVTSLERLLEEKEAEGQRCKTELEGLRQELKRRDEREQEQGSTEASEAAELREKVSELIDALRKKEEEVDRVNRDNQGKDAELSKSITAIEEMKDYMTKQINELKDGIHTKETEIIEMKERVNHLELEISQYQEHNSSVVDQHNKIQEELDQEKQFAQKLQLALEDQGNQLKERDVLIQELSSSNEVSTGLQQEINRLNTTLSETKEELNKLTKELEDRVKEESTKITRISNLESVKEKTFTKIKELKASLDQKDEEIRCAHQSMTQLKEELFESRKQLLEQEGIQQQLKDQQGLTDTLQSEVIRLTEELGAYSGKLPQVVAEDTESELQNEVVGLTSAFDLEGEVAQEQAKAGDDNSKDNGDTRMVELESMVSRYQKEMEEQQEVTQRQSREQEELVNSLRSELEQLREEADKITSSHAGQTVELETEVARLTTALSEASSQVSSLQGELDSKKGEIENSNTRLSQLETLKEKTFEKIKELKTVIDQKDEEISIASTKITELEHELNRYREETDNLLQTDLKQLQARGSGNEASANKDNSAELQQEIAQLTDTLAETEESLNKALEDLEKKEEEINGFSARIAQFEQMKEKTFGKIRESRAQLDEKNEEIAAAYGRIQQLEQELDELERLHQSEQETEQGSATHQQNETILAENEGLRQEVERLSLTLDQVREESKAKVVKAMGKIKDFHNLVEEKTADLSAANARIAQLQSELTQHQHTGEELNRLREGQLGLEERYALEVRDLQEELRVTREQLEAMGRVNDQSVQQLEMVTALQEQMDSVQKLLAAEKEVVEQKGAVITEQEKAIEMLNKTLEETNVRLASALELNQASENSLNSEITRLSSELREAQELLSDQLKAAETEGSSQTSKIAQLTSEHRKAQEQVEYQTKKISEMAELETRLREKIRAVKAERNELKTNLTTVVEERDKLKTRQTEVADAAKRWMQQEAAYLEQQRGLQTFIDDLKQKEGTLKNLVQQKEQELIKLQETTQNHGMSYKKLQQQHTQLQNSNKELQSTLQRVEKDLSDVSKCEKELRGKYEALEKAPAHFDFVMRCYDGNRCWCLVSVRREREGVLGGEEKKLEWHSDEEVLSWSRATDPTSANGVNDSFSIDDDEIELPPTVQEDMQDAFQRERLSLQERIEELSAEKENSQQAFVKYRERARLSLMKTANDQQAAENRINQIQEEIIVEKRRHAIEELNFRNITEKQEQQITELRTELQHEKDTILKLEEQLKQARVDLENQIIQQKQKEEELLEFHTEKENQAQTERHQVQKHVIELEELLEMSKTREKQLMSEMKKKGDTARQIILKKDQELFTVKEAIMQLQDDEKDYRHRISELEAKLAATPVHSPGPPAEEHWLELSRGSSDVSEPERLLSEEEMIVLVERLFSLWDNVEEGSSVSDEQVEQILEQKVSHKQLTMFCIELCKRAVGRETELMKKLRYFESEVKLLRSRHSLLQNHNSTDKHDPPGSNHKSGVSEEKQSAEESEREQRLMYLRQAFIAFFKAKQGIEMQCQCRVICAILGVNEAEQVVIMDSLNKLAPAVVATSTFESLSSNFSSFFS